MKNYLFIRFWLLTCFALVSGVNAETGPLLECGPSSYFQYKMLRGLDTEWKSWKIHLGGQLTVDAVAYDKDNKKDSGLRWETINLRITGSYGNKFHFYIEPDLLGIDTKNNLYEAWAGWDISPKLRMKVGQIRVALNSEFATRPEDFPSTDYGFSSYLDGRYDLGLQVQGLLWGSTIWYQGSATAGQGFDLDGNRKSDPQVSIRAVVFPMQALGYSFLKGGFLGLGLAWSPDYDDEIFLQTPLRSTVFTTEDLDGDSARWIHVEFGWYWGAFRLGAERVDGEIEDVKVGNAVPQDFDQLTSWSAYASWNITGERMRWERGRWLPPLLDGRPEDKKQIFDFLKFLDPLGCLEVAFRYSNADIDRGLFDSGLTTYNPSTQEVRTATLNLNWYPQPGLKVTAGWVKTIADHELSTLGGTNRDSSFILRMSLAL
jgi:phosphate-selective porin